MIDKAIVVWADGSYDINRTCIMCHSVSCSMPVYSEHYKEKGSTQLEVDLLAEDAETSDIELPDYINNRTRLDAADKAVYAENVAPEEDAYEAN